MNDFESFRDLMVVARTGNGLAMSDLLRGLSPRLRAYIRGQLLRSGRREPADVEDVLQTVLLAIHAKQDTYDATQPLSGWVYAIARYKVVDHLRRTQRDWSNASIDDAAAITATDETGAAEASRDLDLLLGMLPKRTRGLIEDVKLRGMTASEAAERVGMSEAAVKVAIHRALKKLSGMFGKPP